MGAHASVPCCSEAAVHEEEPAIEHVNCPDEVVAEAGKRPTVLLPLGEDLVPGELAAAAKAGQQAPGSACGSTGSSAGGLRNSPRWSARSSEPSGGGSTLNAYGSLEYLRAVLNAGDVVLVWGSWLAKQSANQRRLPRRQELPPVAICPTDVATRAPIVAISHCWESLQHPDPHSVNLRTLTKAADQWKKWHEDVEDWDFAVFIDWCSLYQEPRSASEKVSFERGLRHVGLFFAHSETHVWLLTGDNGTGHPYEDRGWPMFERGVSQMITPGGQVLDLGQLDGRCKDWPRTVEVCKARRGPPAVPETFAKELRQKRFSQAADQALVLGLYREVFEEALCSAAELGYGGLGWGDEEARRLAEALPRCNCLLELVLRENRIGDDGVEKLAAAISHCHSLQRLDLCANEIGDHGATRLASALPRCGGLEYLDLARNSVGDIGIAELATVLPLCASLQRLVLGGNEIGDVGADRIAAAIPNCARLQVLDLSENEVGDAGAEKLAGAMRRCSHLRRLDLARNRIGDSGAEEMAAAIPQCSGLQEFGLGGNEIGEILGGGRIGDGGAETLASALARCARLRKLDLSENRIGDRGTEKLAAVMPLCSSLAELDLRRNRIEAGGAGKLAEAVPHCGRLEQLRLSGNPLGGGGERCLREAWRSAGKPEERLLCAH